MTNKSRTLYMGVTNNLMRRVHEDKKENTDKAIDRLVYELFPQGDVIWAHRKRYSTWEV